MTVAGLLLAAGAGTRMGRPKALLPDQRGSPWVLRAAGCLWAGGLDPVVVVVGAAADEVLGWLERRNVAAVVAPGWRDGMGASLRVGLEALSARYPAPDAAMVALVDLPGMTPAVVVRVAAGAAETTLAQATYAGRPGHPVLLGRGHWPGVHALGGADRGARDYLRAHHVRSVECGDLGDGIDVDTPAELPGAAAEPWAEPYPGLRLASDLAAADWLAPRLGPFAAGVGSVVPGGFAAYARIEHSGASADPDAHQGHLEPEQMVPLLRLLRAVGGSSGICWFGVWNGYGSFDPAARADLRAGHRLRRRRGRIRELRRRPSRSPVAALPQLRLLGREYLLYRGALEHAANFGWPGSPLCGDGPDLWWPDERTWCVASEIDLPWTYVGGSTALVDAVLAEPALAATVVHPADRL